MARKKRTENQRRFMQQVSRIKRIQRKLLSEGYSLFDQPDLTMPKRVTKQAIQRLKEITPRRLRNKAEIFVGDKLLTANQVKRLKISLTDVETDYVLEEDMSYKVIIANFFSELGSFPENLGLHFLAWGHGLVDKYGEKEVAEAIKNLPMQFTDYYIAYAPDYGRAVEAFESDLINLLPGSEEDIPQELREEIEGYEEWEEF